MLKHRRPNGTYTQMRAVIASALASAVAVVEEHAPGDPILDTAQGGGDEQATP